MREEEGGRGKKEEEGSNNLPHVRRLQTHQWSESTIKTVTRPYWQVHGGYVERSMQMIVTPRVRAEVQAHFNCPDLEGAELEDQGEDGTALTHWEKRVFEVSNFQNSNYIFERDLIDPRRKVILLNNFLFIYLEIFTIRKND